MMAAPLLNLVYPKRILDRDIAEAERLALGLEDAYTVVVVVDDPARDAALVRLACDMVGRESPAQVVVSRVLRRTTPKPEVASGLTADLALLAEAGDELRQLSRIVDERGLRSSVASRFSDTPWADVAEIAAGAHADVVLVRAGWGATEGADELESVAGQPSRGRSSWSPVTSANPVWRPPGRWRSSRTPAPTGGRRSGWRRRPRSVGRSR